MFRCCSLKHPTLTFPHRVQKSDQLSYLFTQKPLSLWAAKSSLLSQPLVAWLSGQKSCDKLILLFISFRVQSFVLHKIILPVKLCMHKVKQLKLLSHVQLFVMPWSVARQAPLSMGFSRQEYLSRLPCPPPGDLPDRGIELESLMSPALAGRFFTTSASCCCYC